MMRPPTRCALVEWGGGGGSARVSVRVCACAGCGQRRGAHWRELVQHNNSLHHGTPHALGRDVQRARAERESIAQHELHARVARRQLLAVGGIQHWQAL